jgi:hypothetical protein
MAIWRMRIACWIPKATNSHSEYVTIFAFPLQHLLHARASLLRHTSHGLPCISLTQFPDRYRLPLVQVTIGTRYNWYRLSSVQLTIGTGYNRYRLTFSLLHDFSSSLRSQYLLQQICYQNSYLCVLRQAPKFTSVQCGRYKRYCFTFHSFPIPYTRWESKDF